MDSNLVALKLFLTELGVPDQIDTVDDRKRVQKAVYLGQLSRVDLGYRFGWYLMGPYSPSLTRDYYALAEAIAGGEKDFEQKQLQPGVALRLRSVSPLLNVPGDVAASQEDWLEALASVHYLRRVSGHSRERTLDLLRTQKPHLIGIASRAEEALSRHEFLS